MAELLLELFSEEIPARMQVPAAAQLREITEVRFKEEQVYARSIKTFVTPRRLTMVIDGLSISQDDKVTEKRGPRTDAPAAAVEGFLKSSGLALDQLTRRATDKGEFYFAVIQQKGKPTREILATLLPDILSRISWPKSMRWGQKDLRWVRPLKNVSCVFAGEVLKFKFGHLVANDTSYGHRFLGDGAFKVVDFKQYKEELKKRYVVLDTEDRKAMIVDKAAKLAESFNVHVRRDDGLLEEVAGLVEWPEALIGSIDPKFLHLPPEVLVTSIRSHQKYFCANRSNGDLAPYFIVISNMITDDKGAAIVEGNQRVLRARLSDAIFFWEQDKKRKLEDRFEDLKRIVFHAKLGTVAEKVNRVTHLAQFLCVWIPHANLTLTERAAQLSKSDLATGMVGEFPELQGIMGYYYAKEQGEDEAVALAIRDHYSPMGPDDSVPNNPLGIAVALADKLDTLTGMFAAGEKPTGSKDPFALRRAALGVIRIILENGLSIPLKLAFENALSRHDTEKLANNEKEESMGGGLLKKIVSPLTSRVDEHAVTGELLEFFIDRLKALLKGKGVRHDLISAVFGAGGEDDLLRLTRRVAALDRFLSSDDGANLLAGYRRAVNIVSIEEKKDKATYKGIPSKTLLEEEAEKALFDALHEVKGDIKKALKEEKFESAMALLASLRKPIDSFFERVTVNAERQDLRRNRLMLLAQIRELVDEIADFSKIEG